MASRYEPGRGLGDRQVRRFREQALQIEALDDCPELARPGLADQYGESGRGLFLVALASERYGVEPTAIGKAYGAEFALPASPDQQIGRPIGRGMSEISMQDGWQTVR